jgi:NAD(P)-dependent dehydrogenase (short-subunit alcohol dehydrogenase family)
MDDQNGLALVTGAAHGIGLAVALHLATQGYKVVAIDNDADTLSAAPLSSEVVRVTRSITDAEGILRDIAELGHPISVLVNNVGVMSGKSFLEASEAEVRSTVETNLLGTWTLSRLVVDHMIQRTPANPSIIFNLSLHVKRIRMSPDYSATKAALHMLAQEMAFDLGPLGIRVNSVWPGAIDTWSDRIKESEAHRRRSEALVPLRRLGEPQDVATLIGFLVSPQASYITGADIRLDGGLDQFNWLHSIYESPADERSLYED